MKVAANLAIAVGRDETVEVSTASVSVRVRPATKGSYGRALNPERRGKLYVFDEPEPDMERPPYSEKGVDEELDAEWRRYNREEIRIMRGYALDALAALGFAGSTLRFSRKAGCSCGCSPGFHLDAEGLRGADIFVTAKS